MKHYDEEAVFLGTADVPLVSKYLSEVIDPI